MAEFDYASFASAAKSRFRHVAAELGFEQRSGVFYVRAREGWYETFDLQAAGHGNPFFYVNFGIAVPSLAPGAPPVALADAGLLLWERLRDTDETGGFGRESKDAIADSADRVLTQFRKHAAPWFAERNSWEAIAAEYYRVNPIDEEKIGQHEITFGADRRSATYGFLLLKAGRIDDARRWLGEAKRMLCLPCYLTRGGNFVHAKEPHAMLVKREPQDEALLRDVETAIRRVTSAAPRRDDR